MNGYRSQLLGKLNDRRKAKLEINIEFHSRIDSFLFNKGYKLKGQKINTMDTI